MLGMPTIGFLLHGTPGTDIMLSKTLAIAAAASSLLTLTTAQTFQRLGACPTFGCVFPPDQY